jgi:hypothetical protein
MHCLFVLMRGTDVLLQYHILLLLLVLLLLTVSAHTLKLRGRLWQHMALLAEDLCLSPACLATAPAMQYPGALIGDLLLW